MKKLTIYSDGSSLGNPGPGGWGTILKYKEHVLELSGSANNTTNNQMELVGVIEGIKVLKEPCVITVVSDSSYVVNAINSWLHSWKRNGFVTRNNEPIKNFDLWREYSMVSATHRVFAKWVKGHAGHVENERCDLLARTEAERLRESLK